MNIHFNYAHDLPDAGGGACCMGAAALGPGHCTCWETIYDVEQQPIVEGPAALRDKMCADCAFRPDSPERTGDTRYAHSRDGDVDELVNEKFVCHQGMRRTLALVHPSGERVDAGPGAYAPAGSGQHPCKASGLPADYCAGWWAARQRYLAELAEAESADAAERP